MSTPPPPPGPCEWPVDTDCVPGWDDFAPDVQARAVSLATFVLDAFTGHQFQQCPITVRPCGPRCGNVMSYTTWPVSGPAQSGPGRWMTPYILNGLWRNCGCGGGCSCEASCRAELGHPVAEILEVRVNGLTLDPTAYEMIGRHLVRTDGGECWPACQDPSVPDTEAGTFSVTFSPGRLLPLAGQVAAGLLAGEFARACGGGACSLPANISSLTRQGTEIEFVAPEDVLTAGRTGIRETDLFIEAVNPYGRRQRARVFSPDLPRTPVVYG